MSPHRREDDAAPPALRRGAGTLFGWGAGVFHRLHDLRLLAAESLPAPVISVGNLEVGGTGKTPAVIALAQAGVAHGWRPAVLTRGYRGTRSGILRAGAWDDGTPARAAESGDEPLLMSRAVPNVPVVVGKDRARSGRALLAREPGIDLFLLDDGFQHRRLLRDRDLVLLDAEHPLGNGRLLPAGPLREPLAALSRADHVLLAVSGSDAAIPESTLRLLAEHAPRAGRSRVWTEATGLRPLAGTGAPPGKDARVLAVAGIARPERFRASLESLGRPVREWRRFPDHHAFRPDQVAELEARAAGEGGILVTTAKDAVRLEGMTAPGAPWFALDIALRSELGWDVFLRKDLPAAPL